ncbi:kinase [Listeria booriae]|uniref:kinase n=1 Tax=Listeria booriae TaxID=1552123 RepID=UPI001625C480|nr:kinase [Listeria booriae]MBC1512042.1 kinase [Listeria booriae]MBC6150846.1 kinase [Listeria booriae]MBC6305088.1 kinase [Listeria booriae]
MKTLKIWIIGPPGSGKSTLARKLEFEKSILKYDLDSIRWKEGWEMEEVDKFISKTDEITKQDSWIIDGYYPVLKKFLNRADLIICLKTQLFISLLRIYKRTKYRIDNKVLVCNNNKESWEFFLSKEGLLRYTIKEHYNYKKYYIPNLLDEGLDIKIKS